MTSVYQARPCFQYGDVVSQVPAPTFSAARTRLYAGCKLCSFSLSPPPPKKTNTHTHAHPSFLQPESQPHISHLDLTADYPRYPSVFDVPISESDRDMLMVSTYMPHTRSLAVWVSWSLCLCIQFPSYRGSSDVHHMIAMVCVKISEKFYKNAFDLLSGYSMYTTH